MNARHTFNKLFEPGRIGALDLKNRIVMPPMGTRYCGVWGEVTDTLIEWYSRRARGGAGLVIVEATMSATAVDALRPLPCQLRADDTCYIAGLSHLAEAIHENGAKAGIQLSAGGGAQAKSGPWIPGFQMVRNVEPVSPSGVAAHGHTDHPRALKLEEVEKIVELCGEAAWNVKQAGFDLVEVAAAGGYLISEFMSPYFNKRTDKYGGSFENRCRFLLEIVAAMREKVGAGFPLTVKYSIEDFQPGGWDIDQSKALAKKLEAAGVDAIGVSSGAHGAKVPVAPPYFHPKGVFIPYAVAIKSVVKVPVYVVGRLNDPVLAEQVLQDGKADFICEGRALIADPDWPQKVAYGQLDEIRPCLGCNECRHSVHELRTVRCSVNAVAGREADLESLGHADIKKKVLIVGGGPAGLEAARIAALRGHDVILCEKQWQLGGLMRVGGVHNEQITAFTEWLVARIKALPIEVRLQTEVTPALVEQIKPDVVILAHGGTFVTPEVPGIDRHNVFSAQDLMKLMNGLPVDKGALFSSLPSLAREDVTAATLRRFLASNAPIKNSVAIIGGQFPGCSMAIALAHMGKKVVMIEASAQFGRDLEANTMAGLRHEIKAGNVQVLTSARASEINDKGVTVIDEHGVKSLHEVDVVIVALDLAPSASNLAAELRGKVPVVHTIGDAKSFRKIVKAVAEGYVTAFYI